VEALRKQCISNHVAPSALEARDLSFETRRKRGVRQDEEKVWMRAIILAAGFARALPAISRLA